MTDWELLFGDIFGITVECWWTEPAVRKKSAGKGKGEKCDRGNVNGCDICSSRVRVRAHTTGILCFLLSQVSHFLDNSLLLCWLPLISNIFWRFCRKHRLVLLKTTCCFTENDVLFYRKWRVVLSKMTCCFLERTEELWNIRGKRKNRMRWKDKSCWGVWHLW